MTPRKNRLSAPGRSFAPTVAALGLLATLALAACGGSASAAPTEAAAGSTPAPTATTAPTEAPADTGTATVPTFNPADFSNAATNLQNADSYKFSVEMQNASTGTAGSDSGSTVFTGTVVNKPDKAQTLNMIQKDASGNTTDETNYIVIGDQTWTKSGSDTKWQEIPAAQAPAFLGFLTSFRPEQLFSMYFAPGAADNTVVGDEQKNGVATTHYKGGASIGAILSAIAGVSGTWSSDVWISKDGGYLVHSEVSVASATSSSGGSFAVVVDISDINSSSNVVTAP
jgi:hypothetical protein